VRLILEFIYIFPAEMMLRLLSKSFKKNVSSSTSKLLVCRKDVNSSSFHVRGLATSAADIFKMTDQFERRHVGTSPEDQLEMLDFCGLKSFDDLVEKTVPAAIRNKSPLNLKPTLSESEATAALKKMASKNIPMKSLIGMGYFGTITPPVIRRCLIEDPQWYTSYTPYQPEISQGRLEMLVNYQTMITDMTGLEFSNASLLDEGTSAAEAMQLSHSVHRGKRSAYFISSGVHPQTIDLVQSRAAMLGISVEIGEARSISDFSGYSGVLIQYPNTFGKVNDYEDFTASAKKEGCVVTVAADLMALAILKPPGEWGADVCIGSAQRFGVPMFYGGPHAGFFACREKYSRKMPGRIIGVSIDSRGKPGYRLAMQTREQHIRRDKATSNICTAQALLANVAASYCCYHGAGGLRNIATRIHSLTCLFRAALNGDGYSIPLEQVFDTLLIDVSAKGKTADDILQSCEKNGFNIRKIDADTVAVSFDETVTKVEIVSLLNAFGAKNDDAALDAAAASIDASLSERFKRTSEFLTHGHFNMYHSETDMMRYLTKLSNKDISLTNSMISLGSCTMKLNSALEMEPVSWPEFANIHPFAPAHQVEGYYEMIESLNLALAEITGFAAVSTQPNSGAAGEYAGLRCIRNYHEANGESHRDVCLIPLSAHGTNPASAVMAGLKVVTVKSDDKGNVDIEDLKSKAEKHKDKLAALMITYPSTYGVFEEGVVDIIDIVHGHGGQVYMDGANMNAQVALTSPGFIGADVCHLNLHKTFCIPHGGGGPGVGSIGVAKQLAPYLPGHAVIPVGGEGANTIVKNCGSIAAAPFGSAGILPISWMYIHMLGEAGLKKATQNAILNANYMAKRLEDAYKILYRGTNGQCAHEFIIDLRDIKSESDIAESDVAKRLMDFGFHSPTMSWPVAGTLMIEPTESESREELDRFCDAMLVIREEIDDVLNGSISHSESPLHHAPHTHDVVVSSDWSRQYSRETAAYPLPWVRDNKIWPTVGRIDDTYGDRNLVCTCPPLTEYEDM
jgi:glycine dehydrogenase